MNNEMKRIVVGKPGPIRLTARAGGYQYGSLRLHSASREYPPAR